MKSWVNVIVARMRRTEQNKQRSYLIASNWLFQLLVPVDASDMYLLLFPFVIHSFNLKNVPAYIYI